MPWPDIFFKARKPRPEPEAKAAPKEPTPPEVKPAPADAKDVKTPVAEDAEKKPERSTRTIPATHGMVLRPSSRVEGAAGSPPEPIKNIEELMAEADPVRTLSQTGSVRMLKRLTPESATSKPEPVTLASHTPAKVEPSPLIPPVSASKPAAASSSPWPSFKAKTTALPPVQAAPVEPKKSEPVEEKKPEPVAAVPPVTTPDSAPTPPPFSPPVSETPKPKEPTPSAPPKVDAPGENNPQPIPTPGMLGSIFRRRTKMADVARIVLPPKREETTRLPLPPDLSPTVVPSAFPVVGMTARLKSITQNPAPGAATAAVPSVAESVFLKRTGTTETKPEAIPMAAPVVTPPVAPVVQPQPIAEAPKPVEPPPITAQKSPEPMSLFADPPKVDPEAHKPAAADVAAPKVDPEAHRPTPTPAPPADAPVASTLSVTPGARSQEKREFHLTNGEHVAGVVLSETPEAVYVEHGSLGVITIPRNEIAKRLVEIILTNGDRIVGDIMAETADMLYVRHASLGMLSVPRKHRSTRVVEAILKDGDRILGEVLTETDAFTVIRSATLGTITIPHAKLAMLNRKIEQIEMKALPPSAPELKDKA